jgi:hypothetical protein
MISNDPLKKSLRRLLISRGIVTFLVIIGRPLRSNRLVSSRVSLAASLGIYQRR